MAGHHLIEGADSVGMVAEFCGKCGERWPCSADRRLDDQRWACGHCGIHSASGPQWCGAGCGRDHGGMTQVHA